MSVISICHLDWGNELLLSLQPLWKDATLCDTTIECKQKQIIQAHSILLAAASPKLHSYFSRVDQGSYTLVTHEVPVSVWRNILSFIYHGRLEVSEDELVPTYNFARKIEMNQFSKRLGEEIKQRGLCLEQQEAFLRLCRSTSPRGQVMSPKSPSAASRPSTVSPRLSAASPQGMQGQMTSPQGQMSITQGQMMVYQRQGSSPRGSAVTPAVHPDASSDLNPPVSATSPLTSHSNRSTPPFSSQQATIRKPSQPITTASQPTPLEPVPAQTQPQISIPSQRKSTSQRERYECPVCLQSFNRESVLRKHNEGECKVVTQAQSSVVSYKNFYTKIESKEDGDDTTSYKCDLCEKSFGTYQGLYNHLRTKHQNQVQAVTQPATRHFKPGELMGKSANGGGNTRRGGSQLLNRSAGCPICKKQFKTYAQMLSHKNTHKKVTSARRSSSTGDASETTTSGESKMEEETTVSSPSPQPTGEFLCSVCGRSFKKKMHLANHMNAHK